MMEKILSQVYYDPSSPTNYGEAVYKAVKPLYPKITRGKVTTWPAWLSKQFIYTMHKLEIAITTQTPPQSSLIVYKLDCAVHELIIGKLVFMAINALYIRLKIPYMSKNVKQYLISCPTLVLRYISLNILSQHFVSQ